LSMQSYYSVREFTPRLISSPPHRLLLRFRLVSVFTTPRLRVRSLSIQHACLHLPPSYVFLSIRSPFFSQAAEMPHTEVVPKECIAPSATHPSPLPIPPFLLSSELSSCALRIPFPSAFSALSIPFFRQVSSFAAVKDGTGAGSRQLARTVPRTLLFKPTLSPPLAALRLSPRCCKGLPRPF